MFTNKNCMRQRQPGSSSRSIVRSAVVEVCPVLFLLAASAHAGFGAFFPPIGHTGGGGSKITLRKRLHVNTLITEPGTAEVDWNNAWSLSTSGYAMPSAIKYTPEGTSVIWG